MNAPRDRHAATLPRAAGALPARAGHGRSMSAASRRGGWRWLLALLLLPVAMAASAVHAAAGCEKLIATSDELVQLRDSDPVSGVEQGEQALAQAQQRSPRCPAGEAMLLVAIGNNLHILGRLDEAVQRYHQALAILPDDATPAQRAAVNRGAGVALADAGEFVPALDHYLEALAVSQAAGDTLDAAKTAGNIGNLYNTLGEYDHAREYHQQALAGFQATGFKQGVAGTLVNLGAVALKVAQSANLAGDPAKEQRALQEAIEHHRQALALFTELGNERGIGHAESNIAQALARLGRGEEAIVHFHRALHLHQQVGDRRGELNAHVNIAETLTVLGRYDAAARHLDAAAEDLDELPPGTAILIAMARVNLNEAQGLLAEALHWQREVQRLSTTISGEQYSARVLELQARFDTRQQAQEIQLLRSQAEVRDLELSRQRLVLLIAVIVTLLVIVLVAVLYGRLRLGRRVASELKRAARTDPLTGLANRRHMSDRIGRSVHDVSRGGQVFVAIMIDIDGFKAINDRYGHGVGDKVLKEVGRRLGSRLRQQDLLARWGGEEFLVLLPNTDLAGGEVVAESLRRAVADTPMRNGDDDIALSVSLGVCEYGAGMGVDECINRADKAMYAAKRQGGNRVGSRLGEPHVAVDA